MTDPTELDLAAIEARAESVTCALRCDSRGMQSPYCSGCEDSTFDHDCPPAEPCEHTNVYRVAHTDVPALVARVRELEEYADHTSCVEAYTELLARATAAEAVVARVAPSSGCVWGVVGAPACQQGVRDMAYWCRHCLVRSATAAEAVVARVEAVAEEWAAAAKKPKPKQRSGESDRDDGVRIGVWHSVRTAAAELRAALAHTATDEDEDLNPLQPGGM